MKEVAVWLHVRSGARLKERLGRTVRGDDCGLGPSWDDLVLERWSSDYERHYLYCPANELWFWEDEAEKHGWCQEGDLTAARAAVWNLIHVDSNMKGGGGTEAYRKQLQKLRKSLDIVPARIRDNCNCHSAVDTLQVIGGPWVYSIEYS